MSKSSTDSRTTTRAVVEGFGKAWDDLDAAVLERRGKAKISAYRLRSKVWGIEDMKGPGVWKHGVCRCGRVPITEDHDVTLRVSETGGAGLSGLSSCGSVWTCPVCMRKVASHRAQELRSVLTAALDNDDTVALLTVTARHDITQPLAKTLDAVVGAWKATTSGSAWAGESEKAYAGRLQTWEDRLAKGLTRGSRESVDAFARREASRETKLRANRPERRLGIAERWGVVGWVRLLEITCGCNGWHPHIHVVVVFEGQQTEECVRRFAEALWPQWESGLAAHGYDALRDRGGLDIRVSPESIVDGLASYFVKNLAMEVTHAHTKEGRDKGRTPMQILKSFAETGDADDLELWQEFVDATSGRRQLTWSTGKRDLRQRYELEPELTDEEIAEQEFDGEDALRLPFASWQRVADDAGSLLVAAERGGINGAKLWLDARGIRWTAVNDLQPPRAGAEAWPNDIDDAA